MAGVICRRCLADKSTDDFYSYGGRRFARCKACCADAKRERVAATRQAKPTIEERFWARVDKEGEAPAHVPGIGHCWLWLGRPMATGYGQFGAGGANYLAHRYSWLLTHGSLLPDLFVCHKCDNRACVNPSHLFLGTDADNKADMVAKGRQSRAGKSRGAHRWNALMTEDMVKQARELRSLGLTWNSVGGALGVPWPTARAAALGKNWKWVA